MQTPKFLMGGVRFSQNFFGSNTIKAGIWTVAETGIKTAPVIMLYMAAGK